MDIHACTIRVGIFVDEVSYQLLRKVFDGGRSGCACQRVDCVLHRVGRQHATVVAIFKTGLEIPFEPYLDIPFIHAIVCSAARHSHQADF